MKEMNEPELRRIDYLIYTQVMRIKPDFTKCQVCGWPLANRLEDGCVLGNCSMRPVPKTWYTDIPHYSTDLNAAWKVAEYIRNEYRCNTEAKILSPLFGGMHYVCVLTGGDLFYNTPHCSLSVRAETMPLAICQAALQVLDVSV